MENEKQRLSDRIAWLTDLREGIPKTSDKITPRTLEIWSRRLVSIPMSTLVLAANILVERHTFFPALAEILGVCREISDGGADREWKRRLDGWRQEAVTAGEARNLLADVVDKAGGVVVGFQKAGDFARFGRKP